MGLGLNLVKEILGQVKGKIELVDPPPGYTTCFKIQFPISP
jgi:signal transduction histidine kinase